MFHPTYARPPSRKDAGFTLTELVVVIAIVAILSAIAIPTLVNQIRRGRDAASVSDVRQIVMVTRARIQGDLPPVNWSTGDDHVLMEGFIGSDGVQHRLAANPEYGTWCVLAWHPGGFNTVENPVWASSDGQGVHMTPLPEDSVCHDLLALVYGDEFG